MRVNCCDFSYALGVGTLSFFLEHDTAVLLQDFIKSDIK